MIREFSLIDVYYLVLAARWTLALTALAFLGGGLVGLTVALLRVSPFKPLRALGTAYVTIVQGIPLLAWLFVFFFGLPILARYQVSPWIAATIAFSIYAGAFLGEIWRGCLIAIPRQQWEAGSALGLLCTNVYGLEDRAQRAFRGNGIFLNELLSCRGHAAEVLRPRAVLSGVDQHVPNFLVAHFQPLRGKSQERIGFTS